MYKVNEAINVLDTKLEQQICKNKPYQRASSPGEEPGKCGISTSSTSSNNDTKGLNKLWEQGASTSAGGWYDRTDATKMGEHTSKTISGDIVALNKEDKSKVSSAFAKAHEGAEIVITQS